MEIEEIPKNIEIEYDIDEVMKDVSLRNVITQTQKICLAAVKHDGRSLRYVKEQTPEICIAAVKQDGMALCYVKDQTYEICLAAVKCDTKAFKFVHPKLFGNPIKYWIHRFLFLIKHYYKILWGGDTIT